MPLKKLGHKYEKYGPRGKVRLRVRAIFEDARLKARFGHDRTECPHAGLSLSQDPNVRHRDRLYRKVWLTGFDLEKAAMAVEEAAARAPIENDVPIRWNESNQLSRRYGIKRRARDVMEEAADAVTHKHGETLTEAELEKLAMARLKKAGAK